MAGTVKTDLNFTISASAKAAGQAKGTDLEALRQQAARLAGELTVVLKQIQAFHPSGGGDATNYTLLTTILGELA